MNPTLVVMRKELREMLRDKRVRNSAIVMPMLLVVGMLAMFGFISGVGEKENQKIDVVKTSNPIVDVLRKEKFQVNEIPSLDAGQKLIREGKSRLVLAFPQDLSSQLKGGVQAVQAYFDPQQQTGQIALGEVQATFDVLNKSARDHVLDAYKIPKTAVEPLQLNKNEVQVGTNKANELLVALLPYLIVIWAFYGGFGSAGDMVAGEKEKSTLETLLITPVGRSQIAFGKFFSLMTICLMSSCSALLGFVLAGVSGSKMFEKLFPHGLGLGLPEFATIFVVLIPTTAFFASLLIAISTYAKNPREAQSYLALVSFVILMPAVFGQVIGLTDLSANWWIRLIPVLNTSLTVREALQGKTSPSGLAITVAVGLVLAIIGIRIAVRLFKREQVLTRI